MNLSCVTNRPRTMLAAACFTVIGAVFSTHWIAGLAADGEALTERNLNHAHEWCREWSLESRVAQAQLVLVARVKTISAVNVVHGAKVNTALREYRFQPVTVLKGVFNRAELAMTDSDLGLPAPDPTSAPPFEHGEHVLLILTRTRGSLGCVSLPRGFNNPRQLIPRLADNEDPIVSMTRTIIQISETPSRRRRAELGLEKLSDMHGPAVVPLVLSLGSRGYWVQEAKSAQVLADLTTNKSPAVRAAAASTISSVLTAGAPLDNDARELLANALRKLLESDAVDTQTRVAALHGLGHLKEFGRGTGWVAELLVRHLQNARTYAERDAAVSALAELNDPSTKAMLLEELQAMPLDAHKDRQTARVNAAARVAGDGAARVLLDRLRQKLQAGQSARQEISKLGELKSPDAIPVLLQAAQDGTGGDEVQLARTFQAMRDDRPVPMLADWLTHTNVAVRGAALDALDTINSDSAIAAIRLRLKSEPYLLLKLQMAEVLGRHGIDDGNALALEHLADPDMTAFAAKALAAIADDKTADQLWEMLATSHDASWNGAALQGLAALRDPQVGDRLKEILADSHGPLAGSAIEAARLLEDPSLIAAIAPYALSRNEQLADRSIAAITRLASLEPENADVRKQVAEAGKPLLEVLNNPDINMRLRIAALEALRSLNDDRLEPTLRTLADHSNLENTALMQSIDRSLAAL